MTDGPKTYPDTRDGLRQMLLDSDAGFGLYKRYHWDAVMRDVVGPWLDIHDEAVRAAALVERERDLLDRASSQEGTAPLEVIRHEHRVVYPVELVEGSEMTARVLDAEDAEGLAEFINRRLAGWGLPEIAHVESRDVLAASWPDLAARHL